METFYNTTSFNTVKLIVFRSIHADLCQICLRTTVYHRYFSLLSSSQEREIYQMRYDCYGAWGHRGQFKQHLLKYSTSILLHWLEIDNQDISMKIIFSLSWQFCSLFFSYLEYFSTRYSLSTLSSSLSSLLKCHLLMRLNVTTPWKFVTCPKVFPICLHLLHLSSFNITNNTNIS